MPEIRWILLQTKFELEVQMKLKVNWSSFTLSSSPIPAVFTSGWLLFYFTLAIKQTALNFPLYSWSSVGQESETAQQGWLFSVIQCLGPQLERLGVLGAGTISRLIHSHEWRLLLVVAGTFAGAVGQNTDMDPLPVAAWLGSMSKHPKRTR